MSTLPVHHDNVYTIVGFLHQVINWVNDVLLLLCTVPILGSVIVVASLSQHGFYVMYVHHLIS